MDERVAKVSELLHEAGETIIRCSGLPTAPMTIGPPGTRTG